MQSISNSYNNTFRFIIETVILKSMRSIVRRSDDLADTSRMEGKS